ncbi:MAG TPA: ribosome-associated translation inhibitor RaiA [Candidatus Paceibacterota bacterium]|nr:ribosome-associated translation inhibitor RaiA [Candidatus Paceibacterota bacterium]
MRITIKATNMEMSEAISDYLDKRLEKTERFVQDTDPDTVLVNVELGKSTNHHRQGDVFRAEINFCIGSNCLRAVSETEDLYAAIDDARDELLRELRKRKRKQRWSIRSGGQRMKAMIRGLWGREEVGDTEDEII